MLPDTPDVTLVLTGPNGVAVGGLRRGSIVIDRQRISPVETRRLASVIASANATMLDAPVSGGEIGAKSASLSIMVGGDSATFARARPIFACMGHPERIALTSGRSRDQVESYEACNQIAIGGALAGVSEAWRWPASLASIPRSCARPCSGICREPRARGARRADSVEQLRTRIQDQAVSKGLANRERDGRRAWRRDPRDGARDTARVDALVAAGGADRATRRIGTMLKGAEEG